MGEAHKNPILHVFLDHRIIARHIFLINSTPIHTDSEPRGEGFHVDPLLWCIYCLTIRDRVVWATIDFLHALSSR